MTLTFFEQARIPFGTRHRTGGDSLDPTVARALVELGERTGIRVAAWEGPSSIRLQQFIGATRVAGDAIEILPKLDGLEEPALIRQSLLGMLAVTEDLEVRPADHASYYGAHGPFVGALARLYCRQLLEAVRRGLRQDYRAIEEDLPYVRGRIDWCRQSRMAALARTDFHCLFDERSDDTPLNQTLKEALLTATTMLEGQLGGLVTELRHAMDGVSRFPRTHAERARIRTDRMSRHLRPLLGLAKLLLGARNPDLARPAEGDHETYALLWDMNVLFEEFVGRTARRALAPEQLKVDLQGSGRVHLARELATDRKAFLLKPDIVVRDHSNPVVVADTKWKHLVPTDAHLGVAASDMYQVLSYAHRYGTDASVLLYPHHPRLGRPGLQRSFSVPSGASQAVQIDIVSVDLSQLDNVAPLLAAALSPRGPATRRSLSHLASNQPPRDSMPISL